MNFAILLHLQKFTSEYKIIVVLRVVLCVVCVLCDEIKKPNKIT